MAGEALIAVLLTLSLFKITLSELHHRDRQAIYLSRENLQFDNETSPGITKEMLDTFAAIANYASMTYGEDI
jgi:hypothetical protein